MAEVTKDDVGGADEWSDTLKLRGEKLHNVGAMIQFNGAVCTVSIQAKRPDQADSKFSTIEEYADTGGDAHKILEVVGSTDLRIGVASGDYTSGTPLLRLAPSAPDAMPGR